MHLGPAEWPYLHKSDLRRCFYPLFASAHFHENLLLFGFSFPTSCRETCWYLWRQEWPFWGILAKLPGFPAPFARLPGEAVTPGVFCWVVARDQLRYTEQHLQFYIFIYSLFSRKHVKTSEQQLKHLAERCTTCLVHQGAGAGITQFAVSPS